MHVLTSMQGQF